MTADFSVFGAPLFPSLGVQYCNVNCCSVVAFVDGLGGCVCMNFFAACSDEFTLLYEGVLSCVDDREVLSFLTFGFMVAW